ncbi:GEVED domain-containing protein [Mollicutes bacterium LVI A0078]|nr:GEVED domain-containing protein [Mollicutes bacterium LVI A0075]WOO91778.1 GEVED domain-containing protein [Mollicutes bacterium LVI A0078]
MNKRLNLIMLVVIMAQYLVPTSYAASEISSYLVESQSDVSSETQSDNTSESTLSESTSEETSDVSDTTREESEVVESEESSEEAVSSGDSSEETRDSEVSNEETLSAEQVAEIAKSLKPEVRETVLPNVEYNVLNMDAPAGYFVPEESTINGYSNGHNKVSAPNGKTKNVPSSGYVESFSNDPGTLQPDGTISRNTCGVGDDLGRFECESILFPVDTNLGGGQGSNYLGNESGIHSSDEIVIYYPQALDINGRLFDVKSTFSNFVKTSDSQGGDQGGWYTTFAVSHYFYDGYWLVDFQSVQQELQITDSETGEPLNLSEMKVYDFRFGMQSLNASGSDVTGEYTAEALQPYFGIDETTAVPTCDIENKYNYTLDAVAWEGTSAAECNGVSFNTTNTDTIEFRVAKNPSQADSWGNKYWEIAWFVPIFWATQLPTNYTDAGDAPASYGNGEIQLDGEVSIVNDGYGDETITIDRDDQFYLGDSNPLNDMQNDSYGHSDATNDDNNPTDVENFDDETSLDAYLDEGSEVITFRPEGSTIDLEIPYTNEIGYDGQIVVWIDFDDNGNFDQDEATAVPISAGSGVANVTINIPDDAKNCDTYMRVVMNSKSLDSDGNPTGELEDITGKGNAAVFPGLGETEDYGIRLKSDSLISKSVTDEDGDDSVSLGETLTYTITVTNTSDSIPVTNVEVKDSLLQNLPDWIRFNNDVEVNPDVPYNGSLTDGDFVIHEIPAGESVTITFSIELVSLPDGITEIENIVTDNGEDPTNPDFVCDEVDRDIDCDSTITPIIGATTIEKAITNETGTEDGIAEYGEDITYQIKVTNPTSSTANNVEVRDSLLENMPSWMTLIDGPTIDPVGTGTSGSLETKDFVISSINAGQTITITYTVHISDIPTDVTDVTNIATDNGEDPTTVDPETCTPNGPSEDCAIATLPPETIITKAVEDSDGDDKLSIGEQATYTITVTNPANTDATDVVVRDSVYEAISSGSLDFVTIVSGPTLSPALEFTGDMADGSFTITNLPAESSVDISFVVSYDSAPTTDSGITSLINIATDNGQNPSEITDPETECPETDDDCATAEIPLLGETVIDKEITTESNTPVDGIAEQGEEVTYKITITNPTGVDAINTST